MRLYPSALALASTRSLVVVIALKEFAPDFVIAADTTTGNGHPQLAVEPYVSCLLCHADSSFHNDRIS